MARFVIALLLTWPAFAAANAIPTYHRDVAPILQKNCEGCHRPGEAAPMSLTSYKEVRPFAAAIKEAVTLRKMPPWFADPHYGTFSNDRSLSQSDIDTLVAWAKNGAPEGDAKYLLKAKEFIDGWNIGKPDLVLEMPAAFAVPATGTPGVALTPAPTVQLTDVAGNAVPTAGVSITASSTITKPTSTPTFTMVPAPGSPIFPRECGAAASR